MHITRGERSAATEELRAWEESRCATAATASAAQGGEAGIGGRRFLSRDVGFDGAEVGPGGGGRTWGARPGVWGAVDVVHFGVKVGVAHASPPTNRVFAHFFAGKVGVWVYVNGDTFTR